MKYAKIIGVGGAVPDQILTNNDLERMVDTNDQWIQERTGIKQRYVTRDTKNALLNLIDEASRKAIQSAGIEINQIGMIVLATSTPEQFMPSTACLLQERLGIKRAIAFDMQAACSGFVYALTVAEKFMISDSAPQYALVIGAEVLSKLTNWKDRNTCILFGDGAGAVVLAQSETPGIIDCDLNSDGASGECLDVPWGVAQGYETATEDRKYIRMNGREVFKKAVPLFVDNINKMMEKNNLSWDQVDWVVPHQANIRIIDAVAEKLKVSKDKFVAVIDRFGNTSAASIPLAFDAMVQEGKIKKGQTIIFTGFGAGYTWGTVLFKF